MNIVELNQKEVSTVSGGFDLGCFVFTFGSKTVAVAGVLGFFKTGLELYNHRRFKAPTIGQIKNDLVFSSIICGIVIVGNFVGGNVVALGQYLFGSSEVK